MELLQETKAFYVKSETVLDRSEAGAEEQRSSSGFAAERARRATQVAEEMWERRISVLDATDVAVAATTCPVDAALLLGIVPRAGQT